MTQYRGYRIRLRKDGAGYEYRCLGARELTGWSQGTKSEALQEAKRHIDEKTVNNG